MKPWKPRPFHLWPDELKAIAHLPDKKWTKAVNRIMLEDLLLGEENLKLKEQTDD